jgi:hypothetical protein
VQLDAISIRDEPLLSFFRQIVTGSVVDDQEDLAVSVLGNQSLQEGPEGLAVEHFGEPIGEVCIEEPNRGE